MVNKLIPCHLKRDPLLVINTLDWPLNCYPIIIYLTILYEREERKNLLVHFNLDIHHHLAVINCLLYMGENSLSYNSFIPYFNNNLACSIFLM